MQMRQRGSVIIVTLWTITLMTILVAVIASQNRLSAQAAYFHQQDIDTWARIVAAMNQAEMELVLEQMPQPVREAELSSDGLSFAESINALAATRQYRFNGDELQLHYPQPEGIGVRIYSHNGKINLREISRPRLRALIEKKLGGPLEADQQQIDLMMEAWNDWTDLNDGATAIGAEADYYMALDPPYLPRNGTLETVEELLLIRGFAEVFGDVNLEAAFTLYGEEDLVNLNVASVDAMRLLPGLDEELIKEILAYRREKEFQGNGDVAQIVPAEQMTELRPWLNSRGGLGTGTFYYTIMVYPKDTASGDTGTTDESPAPDEDADDEETTTSAENWQTAYSETVFVANATDRPQVLKVNPYQRLPEQLYIADSESEEEDPE